MDLRALQLELLAYVYGEGPAPAHAMGSRPEIYRRNLVHGLCDALASTFALTAELVGRANFDYLCHAHLRAHPLRGNLDEYGGTLPAFLAQVPEVSELPFLSEVAALEWALDRSFRIAPVPALRPEDLHPEQALQLQPSLELVACRHAVFAPWARFRELGPDGLHTGDFGPEPQHIAVWNCEGEAVALPLDPRTGAAMVAFAAGEVEDEEALQYGLALALQHGWLAARHPREHDPEEQRPR